MLHEFKKPHGRLPCYNRTDDGQFHYNPYLIGRRNRQRRKWGRDRRQ